MALFDKILVAYDGSEYSKKALDKAKEFIDLDDRTELHIINVTFTVYTGLYGLYGSAVSQEMMRDIERKNEEVLESIKKLMKGYEKSCYIRQTEGNAADRILAYAEENDIDLIMIGSRGLGAFRGLLLGSVSQHVVQNAECTVTVVR